MATKTCTKCNKQYPATNEYFYKDKYSKDGVRTTCKYCDRKYQKEYHKKTKHLKVSVNQRPRVRKISKYGVGDKELEIELVKGHRYHVPRIKRSKSTIESFTGKLTQETKDLIILKHKAGYCEAFRKVDFLTGELELRKL